MLFLLYKLNFLLIGTALVPVALLLVLVVLAIVLS
jgi:hypothetical protein